MKAQLAGCCTWPVVVCLREHTWVTTPLALQDSSKLPFYQAEKYHQFHDGIGVPFPASYHNLKGDLEKNGKIQSTGCPENTFFF